MSEQPPEPPPQLPTWAKGLAFFCIDIGIASGFAVVFVPGWEIRHVNSPVGLQLLGVSRLPSLVWESFSGATLVLVLPYPDHWL